MRTLFIGDIVGKPGRQAVTQILPGLRDEFGIDVVIANLENLAHGKGITRSTLDEVLAAGVQIGTGGNHTFSKPQALELLSDETLRILRPENMGAQFPGSGIKTFTLSQKKVTVINLLGEVAMPFAPVESPFHTMRRLIDAGSLPESDLTLVDLHAMATSEKVCMGWYLDGKVTAVVGTDTHVPTADTRLLHHATAYVTDVGMVGLRDSSLGVDRAQALDRFLNGTRAAFEIPEHGEVEFQSVLIESENGHATSIKRITRTIEI